MSSNGPKIKQEDTNDNPSTSEKNDNISTVVDSNGTNGSDKKESNGSNDVPKKPTITLCASCDRCRARKTKCDGKKPCSNCAAKYMKKHKLSR